MKVLFIGGTGTISGAVSRRVLEEGHELWLINRGSRAGAALEGLGPAAAGRLHEIHCDINQEDAVAKRLAGQDFDAAADFIAFGPQDVERDYRLFRGVTRQYIFISSASAYQKRPGDYLVNEAVPLANPFWAYSRNKIACEEFLMARYREDGFPVTIVRPSHTYNERSIPLGVHGKRGSWQVARRIIEGKQVIIHGDGTSLWTLTHASDFAEGFVGLLGNIHAIGSAVQITSDETVTWNQVYEAVAAALGRPLRAVRVSSDFLAAAGRDYDFEGSLTGDKANSVVFDNSRLKRLVPGFHARVRFDQGIRATVNWVRAHPECQAEDPEFDAWCDKVIAAREAALGSLAG